MNISNYNVVDTTTDRNGYPRNERKAIIADTRTELAQAQADLIAQGYEVEEVYLHRRNGQNHFHRVGTSHSMIDFAQENNADTTLKISAQTHVDSMMSEHYGDEWFTQKSHRDELKDELEMIQEGLEGDELATVFVDSFGLLYFVTTESAGYSYDMNCYHLGLLFNDVSEG
jgi:hypothetical protein